MTVKLRFFPVFASLLLIVYPRHTLAGDQPHPPASPTYGLGLWRGVLDVINILLDNGLRDTIDASDTNTETSAPGKAILCAMESISFASSDASRMADWTTRSRCRSTAISRLRPTP